MSQREKTRLNQILSLAGLTSRRKADELIKSGRITVNGRLITQLGTRAVWGSDLIEVDGKEISKPSERLYLILNKPFGYICSLNDPEGRPIVSDLLSGIPQRVYPVGRLDFDTLGLLPLTNDGEWAYRLTHPKYHVSRTYKATVTGRIGDEAIDILKKGVKLEDGPSGRSKVTLITRNERQSVVRITIARGKTRQVRRMLEAVEYKVIHLMRIGFGNLKLGNLKVGEYRHLETIEVESMKKLVGMI
ncbi:MAG: rRNA pseudouridine synthase [Desulfobacteraceae bacterium]|nr:rRNA pseudouridine synthase [Desulfobacteraceae bacterium]